MSPCRSGMVKISLAIALLIGLGPGLARPRSAYAEEADKLLPAETLVAIHFNLQQLQKSKLFKKYLSEQITEALRNNEEVQKFQEQSGIDVLKDIHSISMAITKIPQGINLNNPAAVDPKDFELLMIVRGDFSKDRVVKALKDLEAFDTRKYQGHVIFVNKESEEQPGYLCVADDGVILASNHVSRLHKSLDGLNGTPKPKGISSDLKAVIEAIPQGQALWFAMTKFQLLKDLAQNDPNAADFVDKFVGASLSIAVTDKVTASLRAHATDADAAREFRAGFEKLRAMLALLPLGDPNVGPIIQEIINGLKTGQKGAIASLELELNEDALKNIVEQIQRMLGGAVPFPGKVD
ncbi:MAG: hypothetical protein RMI91_07275 [Gemmatales bacterium]|nr:hypothetical protein [Gemmatales bacterium]MDW7994440.1 hypothetical protein [Gemmatales bacterium]